MKHELITAIATRNTGLNILLGMHNPYDWHRVIINWNIVNEYKPNNLFYDVDSFITAYGSQAIKPRTDVDTIPNHLIAHLTFIVLLKRWELKQLEPTQRELDILIKQMSPVGINQTVQDFLTQHSNIKE